MWAGYLGFQWRRTRYAGGAAVLFRAALHALPPPRCLLAALPHMLTCSCCVLPANPSSSAHLSSELATIIKEKKSLLPPTDAEGKRPVTPLDAEIAELEAVSSLHI